MMANTNYNELNTHEKKDAWWLAILLCLPCYRAGGSKGCCCSLVVLGGLQFMLKSYLSNEAFANFIPIDETWVDRDCGSSEGYTIENSVEKMWMPGLVRGQDKNFSTGFGSPCYSSELLIEWNAFNQRVGGKRVSFPSRYGVPTANLSGWWLPAEGGGVGSPRIVLQHGFTTNSNQYRDMLFAYFLRSMGFNVLLNNFRNHCYSQHVEPDLNEWGDAYPYDLLGAWDYARLDPDNIFGGAMDPSKVGLMGFSKGGFTTNNAFGLEGRVPAAWVDAPPWSPETAFKVGFRKGLDDLGVGFLASWYENSIWDDIYQRTKNMGVTVDENTPEKVLPLGPDTKRPLMWVHNKEDQVVSYKDGLHLETFVKAMPEKYALSKMIFEKRCVTTQTGYIMNHCSDHMLHATKYKARLCLFWKSAFNLSTDSCPISIAGDAELSTVLYS